MRRIFSCFALACLVAGGGEVSAQPPALNSHEVNRDGSITFRCYAPAARTVELTLDYDHDHPLPLQKGDDGVWAATTRPLRPALHQYGFAVDGVPIMDPFNRESDPGYVFRNNLVWVTGSRPELWDDAPVPHGVIHHHRYRSARIVGVPEGEEVYDVYTPPGYDAAKAQSYPVLYLLHGWAAGAEAWTVDGQANFILDNLIARRRAKPMIVVMPLGYGDFSFVTQGFGVWNDPKRVADNLAHFEQALLEEIIPRVQAGYRASARREDRAIAGLSMGGGESLVIGLNHPDTFGWVGGFSSAVLDSRFDAAFPRLAAVLARPPRLLWIACGTEDALISPNRRLVAWLRGRGLRPASVETPGIHNWPVWRDNLIHFAPLLFR